jgi:lipid II:glycine glycyltransferase (peptidoglycan interpeptide bridge formation enzyme)
MHVSKRQILGIILAEVYFSPIISTQLREFADYDLISFKQAKEAIGAGHAFRTLHLDLLSSKDRLLSNMSKTTRYEIHRAQERDNLDTIVITNPSSQDILDFSEFYDIFAARKPLHTNRLERLLALDESGGLVLSKVMDKNQVPLGWHAYIVDGERAGLLYSASHMHNYTSSSQRALLGRANRYLHWVDIKTFKDVGLEIFDFGGLTGARGEGGARGIDEFKRGFGGFEVVEYNYRCGRSLAGKLAALAWWALDSRYEFLHRRQRRTGT